jgi:hypothetical protein
MHAIQDGKQLTRNSTVHLIAHSSLLVLLEGLKACTTRRQQQQGLYVHWLLMKPITLITWMANGLRAAPPFIVSYVLLLIQFASQA